MSNNITSAEKGTEFTAYLPGREEVPEVVVPSCGENNGIWYCITHNEGFLNQPNKDSHISEGDHVLTWVCAKHGPEVP
jgi:hypothetical protein